LRVLRRKILPDSGAPDRKIARDIFWPKIRLYLRSRKSAGSRNRYVTLARGNASLGKEAQENQPLARLDGSGAFLFPKIEKSKFPFAREYQGRRKPMNPTQLTDQQCLTIWNCCFDSDLRKRVPLEYVPDCVRLCLEPGAAGTIDGLESMALELWEQDEAALALQLAHWACEQRELN
jgi:hypothetical protein